MGSIFLVILAALAGTGQPVQAAMNSELRKGLESPTLASLVQFALASAAMGVCVAVGLLGRGTLSNAGNVPWWAWLGGVISAVSVTVNLMAVSRVSAGTTIAAALVGQMLAAIVVDHFGWLGVPRVALNPWRIGGAVLLLCGLVLVQKK